MKRTATPWRSQEAMGHVDSARRRLIEMGFQCLSEGKFGLPSYDMVQAWGKSGLVIYFLYSYDGGWDILRQVDDSNEIEGAFQALNILT